MNDRACAVDVIKYPTDQANNDKNAAKSQNDCLKENQTQFLCGFIL